jgi:TRAP-type transport system periplasmic protein
MTLKRRFSRRCLIGSLGALGAAPLGVPRSCRAAETYVMRLATVQAATHPYNLASIHFAQAVSGRSNGQVKVDVYPSGQLVPQQAFLDALTSGVADFAITSATILAPLVPRFQIFDMPFMFRDYANVFRVLDGAIGEEFAAEFDTKGVKVLTWSVDFKEISTTTKAVVVPEDMKGLRMRIQNGPVFVATYQALGAIPVVIDATEIFVALQQRTVDAIDINLNAIRDNKYYTLIRHVALANHILAVGPLFGSKRKIEALPPALQKIIKEEGRALEPFWRALTSKQTAADIQTLKDNGVAFTEIQYAPFRKAMEPVYAMFQAKLGVDLFERVSRAAGA